MRARIGAPRPINRGHTRRGDILRGILLPVSLNDVVIVIIVELPRNDAWTGQDRCCKKYTAVLKPSHSNMYRCALKEKKFFVYSLRFRETIMYV